MSWITGLHAIEEILSSGHAAAELLVAGKGKRVEHLRSLARRQGIALRSVGPEELKNRAGAQARIAALRLERDGSRARPFTLEEILAEVRTPSLLIAVDGVTDPHNLGAILRSADQVAAAGVIVPVRRNAGVNDTVMRTSSGAAAHLPVIAVPNLSRALEACKAQGYWIYAAAADGHSILEARIDEKSVLVMGSEGKGPSRNTLRHADAVISIPSKGQVDSFNVSVATGILAFEMRRLQGFW